MKNIALVMVCWLVALYSYGQGNVITVKLHSVTGYGAHEAFAQQAATALEKVLNSDEFRRRVLSGKFIKTNGLSNQELYDKIMLAHEQQGPGGNDRVVDLRVRTLRIHGDESRWKRKCRIGSRAGTIGIDGNGDGVTAICPQRLEKWAKENNIASLAGHYAHEYIHIIGFNHYRWWSTDRWRQRTFVYKIGNLVEELVKKEQIS